MRVGVVGAQAAFLGWVGAAADGCGTGWVSCTSTTTMAAAVAGTEIRRGWAGGGTTTVAGLVDWGGGAVPLGLLCVGVYVEPVIDYVSGELEV